MLSRYRPSIVSMQPKTISHCATARTTSGSQRFFLIGRRGSQGRCVLWHPPTRRLSRAVLHVIHGGVQDSVNIAILHVVVIDNHEQSGDTKPDKLLDDWAARPDAPMTANDSRRKRSMVPCRKPVHGRPRSSENLGGPRPHTRNADRLLQH